jgi:hypothetical protein
MVPVLLLLLDCSSCACPAHRHTSILCGLCVSGVVCVVVAFSVLLWCLPAHKCGYQFLCYAGACLRGMADTRSRTPVLGAKLVWCSATDSQVVRTCVLSSIVAR